MNISTHGSTHHMSDSGDWGSEEWGDVSGDKGIGTDGKCVDPVNSRGSLDPETLGS